jgi:hypothetical protein
MLAAYKSQADMITRFPLDTESFRPAPSYRFTTPPHGGQMYYERHRLPMTWHAWRRLAGQATQEFEEGAERPHRRGWLVRAMSSARNLIVPH